jgi:hypothetical protein
MRRLSSARKPQLIYRLLWGDSNRMRAAVAMPLDTGKGIQRQCLALCAQRSWGATPQRDTPGV